MTKRLVIDASAAAKWYVKENGYKEMQDILAMIIRGELIAYAPTLLVSEVGNTLARAKGLDKQDLVEAIKALKVIGIKLVSDLELVEEAVKIASEDKITVYDALYISLARRENAKLLTYDRKLLDKYPENTVLAEKML